MRDYSLAIDILAGSLQELLLTDDNISDAIRLIKGELPSITDEDAKKVFMLTKSMHLNQVEENVEIVATTPVSFLTKVRKTRPVINDLITGAEKTSGY